MTTWRHRLLYSVKAGRFSQPYKLAVKDKNAGIVEELIHRHGLNPLSIDQLNTIKVGAFTLQDVITQIDSYVQNDVPQKALEWFDFLQEHEDTIIAQLKNQ